MSITYRNYYRIIRFQYTLLILICQDFIMEFLRKVL